MTRGQNELPRVVYDDGLFNQMLSEINIRDKLKYSFIIETLVHPPCNIIINRFIDNLGGR